MYLFRVLLLATFFKTQHSVATNCSDVAIVSKSEFDNSLDEVFYCLSDLPSIVNDTEIRLYFKEIVLTERIEFADIKNLSVVGYSHPILRCLNNIEAGLSFSNVHNLTIRGIEVQNCGTELKLHQNSYENIWASIAIQNCANVWISDIRVKNGPGTGVAFFDIEETLTVLDSIFEGNGYDGKSGGNGVYLEITEASKNLGPSPHYNFTGCKFIDNKADTGKDSKISGFSRFDKGGGFCCCVRSQDSVTVTVQSAVLSGNIAPHGYGGGIYASFHNNVTNSIFVVKESNYTGNQAMYGGGQYLGYLHNRLLHQTPLNCKFLLEANMFTDNWAVYGGGSCIFSTPTDHNTTSNTVSYDDCEWRHNTAQFGSAITILPNAWNIHKVGFLPTLVLSDTTIDSNYANTVVDNVSNLVTQYSQGSGALYCADHELHFQKSTTFSSNNGSALYMGSCRARFGKFSHTTFSNNTGKYGGAIYLSSSSIELEESIELVFESNRAYSKGGAIYQNAFNFHMYSYSRTCFFSTLAAQENPLERNITVRFVDNFAGNRGNGWTESTGYGHSMYVYSLLPCHRYFRFLASELTSEIFNLVGNFTYTPDGRPNEIATDARQSYIYCNESKERFVSVIPGKEEMLPYLDQDDLGHNITTLYLVAVQTETGNSTIEVDQAYQYISTNEIKLHGSTNDEGTLVLSALTTHQRALFFRVKILPCPPGFTDMGESTCQCAFNTKYQYCGIQHCKLAVWRANKVRGYWVGYESGANESEDTLVTGLCPIGFCEHKKSLLLPTTASRLELNKAICPDSRTGVLCGQCKENTSVYYHSLHFQCKPNNLCKLGWLFYILTEILPVTIVFLFIIFFNISFTSGVVNGFIFYSQVGAMLRVSAGGIIPFPVTIHKVIQFVYLSFSLNPFILNELSFCLCENANTMDIISISYITLLYAFFLVIGIIVLMNKLGTRYCCQAWRKCRNPKSETLQGSMIHGFSAFLVLCYAKCTQASILLISFASIQGKASQHSHKVVFYNGEVKWFSKDHLPYAIPAIVMSLLIVQAPPILLLVYPMHYKILAFLRIAESRSVRIIFNPLEKMKPLLDSFQGSFKDEFRYFSGLYFLYRLAILINVSLSNIQDMHFILSGLFLFILLLHTVCQPYKEKRDNLVDSLLFLNLATINGLTAHNLANTTTNSANTITVICWIQIVLIFLPLAVVFLCVARKWLRCKELLCKVKMWKGEPDDRELPEVSELENLDKESSYKRLF